MMPKNTRIFVCNEPQDMRRSGAMFCFVNKRRNRLKVIWWERNGYCLLCKRLHRAAFEFPAGQWSERHAMRIDGRQLARLLEGVVKKTKA